MDGGFELGAGVGDLGRVSLDKGSVAAKGGASAAVLPFIARLIAMLDRECISFARQVVEKAATAVGPVENASFHSFQPSSRAR